MKHDATQHTENRHHRHHTWMIGAEETTSIRDAENLILDKTEFLVGGCSFEQLSDRLSDQATKA